MHGGWVGALPAARVHKRWLHGALLGERLAAWLWPCNHWRVCVLVEAPHAPTSSSTPCSKTIQHTWGAGTHVSHMSDCTFSCYLDKVLLIFCCECELQDVGRDPDYQKYRTDPIEGNAPLHPEK